MKHVFWMAGTAMSLMLAVPAFAAAPASPAQPQPARPAHALMQVADSHHGNSGHHGNRAGKGNRGKKAGDHDNRNNHVGKHDNRGTNRGKKAGEHDNRDNHVGEHDNRVRPEASGFRGNANAWRNRYPNGIANRPGWSRGDRLYGEYRQPKYRVTNWRRNNLQRPPRGSHWVRVGNDYMLIRNSNGVIREVRPGN